MENNLVRGCNFTSLNTGIVVFTWANKRGT